MKKHINKILSAVVIAAALQSCGFKDDVNTDPVNPTDAPMAAILPVAQVGIGYTLGGNIARYNGMFTQQIAGVDRQALSIGKGNIGQQDTDDPWDNLYKSMKNLDVIIGKADAQKSPHYKGVAQIMMAYSLGITTDMWGDVPYSEAFKGSSDGSGLRPKYDKQETLYANIQTLLDKGIENCNAETSNFSPASDDVIYNGNLGKWISLANALKARHYLHLTKRDPSNFAKVIEYAELAMSAGFSDAFVPFSGTSVASQNPMSQFNDQRGDIGMASKIMDYFRSTADTLDQSLVDPRLFAFTDFSSSDAIFTNDTVSTDPLKINYIFNPAGSYPGDGNFGINFIGGFTAAANSPVYLMTLAELKFMMAEAKFRAGSAEYESAVSNYRDGIQLSLIQSTGTSNAFIVDRIAAVSTTDSLTLEKVMTQKWVALFMQSESWNDWRRTGIPSLDSPIGNPLGEGKFPIRYPYPQKERTLNSANIPDEGSQPALKPVWWAQ
jgi:hypothetical protein